LGKCSAIARSGNRCKGIPIDASGLCHAHHPQRVEARRRAGSKGGRRGGRGRPQAELSELKDRLTTLAEDVLEGRKDRGDAAVASQIYNVLLRAVSVELKLREQEEVLARVEELEALMSQKKEAGGWR
jgi:hypothetical protein